MGGVSKALAHSAEAAYQALSPKEQEAARRVLLRLIQLGEGSSVFRRRADLGDLKVYGPEDRTISAVVSALTEARLLILDRGSDSVTRVELAHEALIRSWPRLGGWVEEDREFLHWRNQLTVYRESWHPGKSDGLLTGFALDWAQHLLETREHDLSLEETEYIKASLKHRRRVQGVKVSGGVVAVVVSLMIFYLDQQTRVATETIQTTVNWVREVVQEVPASVSSRDRRLLALREGGSVRLLDSFLNPDEPLWEKQFASPINNMDFDPTSRFLVLVTDGSIGILEIQSRHLRELKGGTTPFVDIQFNPDGKTFRSLNRDGLTQVWDVATGQELKESWLKRMTKPIS
jgi:hypothetical protein